MSLVRSVYFAFALLIAISVATANAQTAESRTEIGAHITLVKLSDLDASSVALGARAGVDLTRWAALDFEFNFAPRDTVTTGSAGPAGGLGLVYRRSRVEGFAGAKVGYRGERVGVFAKVRPGFTRLNDKGVECRGEVCIAALIAAPDYKPEFALDFGGIVEFYPTGRVVTRFDIGDTLIRHRAIAAPPCASCSSHNLSSRFGVGFRF